jgi:serine/threonine protein kinase
MGVVYEAEQEALGRRVAIKVLPGRLLANQTLRARFRREAQAAARLHHTNIVPVFGVGECDGQCFYVMQLIEGRGLDRVIHEMSAAGGAHPETENAGGVSASRQDTPTCDLLDGASEATRHTRAEGAPGTTLSGLTPGAFCRAIARIGVGVADALADAHAQGVLHRDIKPSNLLLDERGAVWVTDFGVAKLVEEANLTQSGDLVGTLKYMPPERFLSSTGFFLRSAEANLRSREGQLRPRLGQPLTQWQALMFE